MCNCWACLQPNINIKIECTYSDYSQQQFDCQYNIILNCTNCFYYEYIITFGSSYSNKHNKLIEEFAKNRIIWFSNYIDNYITNQDLSNNNNICPVCKTDDRIPNELYYCVKCTFLYDPYNTHDNQDEPLRLQIARYWFKEFSKKCPIKNFYWDRGGSTLWT
jgi:hypothetical protein